ncbi:heme ABC transporter ATP-binding protein [Chitinophaga sp. 30R24]|uniref:heme ABC transporter ATP-binding protein n=1 Tax=Chitinophaga sp. 30R24 TaxID=3248838 RepID=UPI003B8F010F
MLEIHHLSLSLSGRPILEDIHLQASPGELCVLMGANGAGKSSLLQVVAGNYTHYTGQVRMAGKSLRQLTISEQAHCRAVLSQRVNLHLPFTVAEIVAMGRYVHTRSLLTDKHIVEYAMQVMEVDAFKDRSWLTLSGGQQQRVHLARVLAQLLDAPMLEDYTGKKMLLLDEPVTGMDIRYQQLALQLARELTRYGILVIAVLHDFQLAAAWADRIFMLHRGQLFATGTPEAVLTVEGIHHCFGIHVQVLDHPSCNYPIVVTANHHHHSKKILTDGNNYFSA